MSIQIGGLGLCNVEHEMKLLLQRSQDSSRAGVPLRTVYESVAVSGDLYNLKQGLSCDVAVSIPKQLCDATSRASCAQILDEYSSKIHAALVDQDGRYSILKKMEAFCQIGKNDPTTHPSKKTMGALKDLTDKCNESYEFLSNLQSQVFEAIKVETESVNKSISGLFEQYEDMKKSSHSNRALMTGRYYDGLLELSESIGIEVPLSGIEDGDMPSKVSVKASGRVLEDVLKSKLVLGVELVDPNECLDAVQILIRNYDSSDSLSEKIDGILYADLSDEPNSDKGFTDGKTTTNVGGKTLLVVDSSKTQAHGKLGALLQLYTRSIPEQQRHLHKFGEIVLNSAVVDFKEGKTSVRKGTDVAKIFGIFPDITSFNKSQSAISAALNGFEKHLSEISEMRRSAIEEKKISEDLIKRAQIERENFVKISQNEYLERMWKLNMQKELLMRILDTMMSFYKSVSKLGSGLV